MCLDFIFIISMLLVDDYTVYLKAYLLETSGCWHSLYPETLKEALIKVLLNIKYIIIICIIQKFQLQFEMLMVA